MWIENPVFREDLEQLAACEFIPWQDLEKKTILITGATGLIGYMLTSALLYRNLKYNSGIQVAALVRDLERGRDKFSAQIAEGCGLILLEGSVEQLPEINGPINYIVHGAGPTASAYFVEKPVETITSVVMGTRNLLELGKTKQVSGFVYLSSMEVYGKVISKTAQAEKDLGYLDLFSPRSSYPESKRMAESLCCAYFEEYGVPATSARLAQTFGPGVAYEDERVFAYAARCALKGENICLHTSGTKENMYLYTADAVSAILLLLIRGERGTAYNAANPETYCSVKEMSELAAELGAGKVSVITNCGGGGGGGAPPRGG